MRAVLDMVPWHHVYGTRYPILGEIPSIKEGERIVTADGFVQVFHNSTWWVEERPFSDVVGFTEYLEKKIDNAQNISPELPCDFKEKFKHAKKMLGDTVLAHPYVDISLEGLYVLAGWEILAPMTVEKPELIAKYLDTEADIRVKRAHMYLEYFTIRQSPVVLVHSDIAHNNGLLFSPNFLRMTLKPALKKIAAAFHEHGIKVVYHSEGNIREFIDDLIEAGADGINPPIPSEGMDPVEIRQEYPDLILWGGIDNRDVLVSGTSEEVKMEVERVVSGVGRGLILSAGGGVHPVCKVNNCIAMVDALQKMGEELS